MEFQDFMKIEKKLGPIGLARQAKYIIDAITTLFTRLTATSSRIKDDFGADAAIVSNLANGTPSGIDRIFTFLKHYNLKTVLFVVLHFDALK